MDATPPRADKRPLYAIMLASGVSMAGNSIALLAIPWYVLRTTGDATQVGLAAAAGIAAYVLGSFFGGNLADRFDRRSVSIVADLASGLGVLAIPALAQMDALTFELLLGLVFLGGLMDAPGHAARAAMVPDVARLARVSLERANGLVSGAANLSEVVGPALAGVLLVSVSTPTALVVDGLTFFISLLLMAIFVPRGLGRGTDLGEENMRNVALADGLKLIAKPGATRVIVFANAATNFIGAPLFTVIMVVYLAEQAAGGLALGAVVAVGGVGMVVGALAFSRWGERMPRRTLFVVGFAAFGIQYWFLLLDPHIAAIVLIFLVRGVLTGAYNPIADTVLQERVPPRMLATVYGTAAAIAMIGEPVGLVIGGLLTHHYGVHTAILVCAIGYGLVTVLVACSKSLHDMSRPRHLQNSRTI